MSEPEKLPERLKDLIEDYLDGILDEAGMQELEGFLRADARARVHFVRYARLHTDLHLEARAWKAGGRVLERIEKLAERRKTIAFQSVSDPEQRPASPNPRKSVLRRFLSAKRLGIAAGILIVLVGGLWVARGRFVPRGRFAPAQPGDEPAIAWLVNAQDCTWSGPGPMGNLKPGTLLCIDRGLAEIRFQCEARVLLEGPSKLELLSGKSARLVSGKLTARVPPRAIGFEVLSEQGKVIDLGTEFGIRSSGNMTEVVVFEGKVEAHPADASKSPTQSVKERQAAQITPDGVTIRSIQSGTESRFIRTIATPPVIVPRTLRLAFDRSTVATIKDSSGLGTGLTHRLPGTGKLLSDCDSNLRLNQSKSQLELTTTNSDLNTQYKLGDGEYFGLRLADLGFTGEEDFAATVTIPNIPALDVVGQFGLYAGAQSDESIRGGLIGHQEPGQYTQFLVNNDKGCDSPDICKVGLLSTGTDLRLTLKRTGGKYSLTVENLTTGNTSTLTVRHPDFLDGNRDLYVGLFGANTQSEVRKTLIFKDFQATVWTAVNPR